MTPGIRQILVAVVFVVISGFGLIVVQRFILAHGLACEAGEAHEVLCLTVGQLDLLLMQLYVIAGGACVAMLVHRLLGLATR